MILHNRYHLKRKQENKQHSATEFQWAEANRQYLLMTVLFPERPDSALRTRIGDCRNTLVKGYFSVLPVQHVERTEKRYQNADGTYFDEHRIINSLTPK